MNTKAILLSMYESYTLMGAIISEVKSPYQFPAGEQRKTRERRIQATNKRWGRAQSARYKAFNQTKGTADERKAAGDKAAAEARAKDRAGK